MMGEAEKIAAGLTEAQKRRLILMKPNDPNYSGHGAGSSFASVVRAGLAYKTQPTSGGWPYYRLTETGLSVKAIIERESHGG
jgi:hypothetical protein